MHGERSAELQGVDPTRIERIAESIGALIGRLDVKTARIKPWMVLGPLIGLSWGVMAYVSQVAVHNGTFYYEGGDGTWYYGTAWELGQGRIPVSAIGYGYPLFLAPLAHIAGPNLLAGLPLVIGINAIVLVPIALLSVYGIAKLLAGQRFAFAAAALWVVAPILAIHYFTGYYHRRYVGQTLPAVLGLTPLGDFPSMVALLVAAYFGLRAMLRRGPKDALLAGIAIGLALSVKPANAVVIPAFVVGFIVARRPRELALVLAGMVPAVICLTIWKYRGLGDLPLFATQAQATGIGASSPPLGLSVNYERYVPFNWNTFASNIDGLREFMWSRRLIEWSIVGGLIGLIRRSAGVAALMSVWLASYLLLKGGSVATIKGGSFFRYLAPGFPAAFFLALSLPFLVPIAGRRLAAAGDTSGWPSTNRAKRRVMVVAIALAAGPLIPLLAFPVERSAQTTRIPVLSQFAPANRFRVQLRVHRSNVTLSWPSQSRNGTRVKYAIYRSSTDQLYCESPTGAALSCSYPDTPTVVVHGLSWTDTPGPGTWTYRVMVVTGAISPIGDINVLLSTLATAQVAH